MALKIDPTASASEVREYITTLLTSEYDIPDEEARSIADKWRYGKGAELLEFDRETLCSIFGAEVGALLFGKLKMQARNQRMAGEKDGERPRDKEGAIVGIVLMAVGGATFLYVAWMFRDYWVVSGVVCAFGVFCWSMGVGALFELRD